MEASIHKGSSTVLTLNSQTDMTLHTLQIKIKPHLFMVCTVCSSVCTVYTDQQIPTLTQLPYCVVRFKYKNIAKTLVNIQYIKEDFEYPKYLDRLA